MRVRASDLEKIEGRTDWARLAAMTEEEIERNAIEDPDNPPWTEEELRNAQIMYPPFGPKQAVSIRLDNEVISYFKEQGPGYQSRISGVLLSYVRTQKRASNGKQKAKRSSKKPK